MKDLASIEAYRNVFGDLFEAEKWCIWRLKDGVKLPYSAYSSGPLHASTDTPMTWASGELAYKRARYGKIPCNGIGYVFHEDGPLVGVDLDKCRDPRTGDIEDWAREVVDRLDSYTEISPSGTGLHIYVRSDRPLSDLKDTHDRCEIFSRTRYFTCTLNRDGLRLGNDKIVESPDGIGWLKHHYLEEPTQKKQEDISHHHSTEHFIGPDEWVEDALEHIDPDIGYHDWLAVGMALHHEYGGSDKGFAVWNNWSMDGDKYSGQSELRKKWESFGGEGYTGATIYRAAKLNGWNYKATVDDETSEAVDAALEAAESASLDEDDFDGDDEADGSDEASARDLNWHSYGTIVEDDSPFQPYFVEPGVIGPGDTAMIFSPPKTLKSMAVLDQCAHWAAGKPWLDLKPQRPLKICMLNFELKYDSLRRRRQLLQHDEFSRDEIQRLENNLLVSDRYTPSFDTYQDMIIEVYRSIQRIREGVEWDLFVIDPIVNAFQGEENDNGEVMDFLGSLRQLADGLDPSCALYLVHHTSKMSREERQKEPFRALRGGSAFRGAYDTGIALSWCSHEREKLNMSFEVRNGEGVDDRQLEFDDGVFRPVDGGDSSGDGRDRQTKQMYTICRLIDQKADEGRFYTKNGFAKAFSNVSGLQSKKTIRRRIDALVSKQVIGFKQSLPSDEYPEPSGRSVGFLCTCHTDMHYTVGQYGDCQMVSEEAADETVSIEPDFVEVGGEIVKSSNSHAPDSLNPVDIIG